MTDNKYCINDENVLEVPHLDWFEASIWSSFAGVSYFISEIKKTLYSFFSCRLDDRYGNQRYYDSLRNDELGIVIFHNVRNNMKNPPISVCFSGRFFRYDSHVEFITWLLKFFNSRHDRVSAWRDGEIEDVVYRWQPIRVDASIDFVSFGKPFIPYPQFKSVSGSVIREFSSVFRGEHLSKIWHGKDGSRITVYNKLFDDHDAEFVTRHPEYEGFSSIWRLEYQFRRSEIKGLYKKNPFLFGTYSNLFNAIMGQCSRRYQFDGLKMNPSLISSYLPRRKLSDEAKLQLEIKKWFSCGRKVKALEGIVFPLKGRPSYQKTLAEEDFQKNLDFYQAYFDAVEEEK